MLQNPLGATRIAFAIGVASLLAPLGVCAQSAYPDKPVRILAGVSVAEGVARLFGPALGEALGKPAVIELIPGAAGNIAADKVAKSAPDGHTLLMTGDAAMTTNVSLYDKLSYDPAKDFAPIALLAESMNILVVPASVPAKTVRELMALAKASPGKLTYASTGSGTSQHLAGALFNTMAGVTMVHVPYKGVAQLMPDLIAGRLESFFGNVSIVLPFVREGKLRALGATSLKRAVALPDVPTIAESGYPGFEAVAWFGLLAPAGTPPPVLARLNKELARVAALPDTLGKLTSQGLTPAMSTPEEFAARIKAEIVSKGKIVRDSGAKAN